MKTKVRETIEEKIVGMGEERKMKWLQKKAYFIGHNISGSIHNLIERLHDFMD